MQHLRKLALLGAAVMLVCAAMASAAMANGTVHTGSTTGPIYSGSLTGTTSSNSTLGTSWGGTITCTKSIVSGTINGSTGVGSISAASWTSAPASGSCTEGLFGTACTATASNLSWGATLTSASSVSFSNTKVSVNCPSLGLTCNYGGSVTGAVTNPVGSTPGTIKFTNASVALQSGSSFGCGSGAGTWNATYNITGSGGVLLYTA